jgi:aspartate/methionine/tyrosine aminotransferase
MRARYAKRCDLVEKLFSKYPDFQFIKPEGTFYAFVKVPGYIEDVEVFVKRLLEEKGVVVSAGKAYGQSSKRFIRLSFATNDLVIEGGITRIGELANQIKNKQ